MPIVGTLRALQEKIQARAWLLPPDDAVPLLVANQVCGILDPGLARRIAGAVSGFRLHAGRLELTEDPGQDADARTQRLLPVARLLVEQGLVSPWRDEELDVRAASHGPVLARIDRCAVRVLGITTYSVHLNGYAADGRLVVARRAAHKRVDPGLWDNLAGGMIAAGEPPRLAVAREAYEEAGVCIDGMPVTEGARIGVRRPIGDGVLAEIVHVYDVDLPADAAIENRDGEVEEFAVRSPAEVCAAIERDEFTVEAALATLESLLRRGQS